MSESLPPNTPTPGTNPVGPLPGSATHDPFQAAKASALKAAEELRQATAMKAQELRHSVETRAHDLRTAAEHKAEEFRERATEVRHQADQAIQDARARYDDLRSEAEHFAREKPLQALATAFGVGLVIGLILRR